MKKYVCYGWKSILFAEVVVVMLVSAVQAFETAADSQDVTLSATVREPSGTTGTVAFTFELEEMPAGSAVLPNYSTLPPQPSAAPEPSTLVLVGFGGLGLALLRRMWEKYRVVMDPYRREQRSVPTTVIKVYDDYDDIVGHVIHPTRERGSLTKR